MFLNIVTATEGQIRKIEEKYFTNIAKLFQDVECAYDGGDDIYFITIRPFINSSTISFQVRRNGTKPMFFSLLKGGTRYEISYPEGKLYNLLKEISAKAIADWKEGSEL